MSGEVVLVVGVGLLLLAVIVEGQLGAARPFWMAHLAFLPGGPGRAVPLGERAYKAMGTPPDPWRIHFPPRVADEGTDLLISPEHRIAVVRHDRTRTFLRVSLALEGESLCLRLRFIPTGLPWLVGGLLITPFLLVMGATPIYSVTVGGLLVLAWVIGNLISYRHLRPVSEWALDQLSEHLGNLR